MSETADRVDNAHKVIGSPYWRGEYPVKEGEHYKVIAYTDWADEFVPTIVEWRGGVVDNFTDLAQSRKNAEKVLA